jgi:hypothetical protein
MDTARVARRLGADEALIVYRRSRAQVERIRPARARGEVPVRQIPEELVDQLEPRRIHAGQPPNLTIPHHPQPVIRHET